MIEYIGSGDFTPKDKALRALKNNVPMLIAYIVAFLLAVIILSVSENGREILKKYLFNDNGLVMGYLVVSLALLWSLVYSQSLSCWALE